MMKAKFLLCLALLLSHAVGAQLNYTANDQIRPYEGHFRPGVNLGIYPPWTNEQLADLAAGNAAERVLGVGAKAARPALYGHFVEEFGYDFELDTYEHFEEVGLRENTLIVGFPSAEQRDPTRYCPGVQSELFANLYLDIWDGGANGTPVNDNNYYALYLYNLVTRYKEHIRFWEIWNEPGFDYTGALGWLPPGTPENWWDNNPNPCDYKLRAPIFHYVRLLRISFEVIKTFDPDAYIVVSGVGYPSFLDAILRNTDNPVDGSPTGAYPRKGGAYFDVMGFHSYPHFDGTLKEWDNSINAFRYSRHSDAAAQGLSGTQQTYRDVLENYGYDGQTYPQKLWIMTEGNIPRKTFGDFIGSEEAQRNYIVKAVVECMINDILQLHIYKIGEESTYDEAQGEFQLMGLYKKLTTALPYYAEPTQEGTAYKTASDLLFEKRYDAQRTSQMALPQGVRGGAFYDENNRYTYVLWAETTVDRSEAASATYSFPAGLNTTTLVARQWDYTTSRAEEVISTQDIELTGSPVFLSEALLTADLGNSCAPLDIDFKDNSGINAARRSWTFPGGQPATSTAANPTVSYSSGGNYTATLELFDNTGQLIARQALDLPLSEPPSPAFSSYTSGPLVVFTNESANYLGDFLWDFGDGQTSTEPNPTHVYFSSGTYTIELSATNTCGTRSTTQTYTIQVGTTTQLGYTANDTIIPYDGVFRPGVNMGVYDLWSDEQLADISAGSIKENVKGVGAKVVRPLLTEKFLEKWGYDIRLETFQHYINLDLEDNTVIIGFPTDEHRDPNYYCATDQSELFENMYLDIWDNGENGTPVNDDNYYALFLYKMVSRYKDYVKFWEIWNEPSFDYSGLYGWLPPGQPGNWWENNPNPCDYKLRAPIFHLVRMLRISYEVIKHLDEEAYVTLSGVAFPSFLDAVLRNTDNPRDGSVAPGYERKGGAYFDVMGFHNYPHFDGSTSYYDVDEARFVYTRHSDAAVQGITTLQDSFKTILSGYGYNNLSYPEKLWIITESNLPRKAFGEFMGSEEAQRNYILKAYVQCVRNEVLQLHVYKIGEETTFDDAFMEFNLMGLYEKLDGTAPYAQKANEEGIAYKTASDLLFGSQYDAGRTNELSLPDFIDGAAFIDNNGQRTYVLWAKTATDQSEEATATYSFPAGLNIDQLHRKAWDYSETVENTLISSQNVQLSGTPIFLSEVEQPLQPPVAAFDADRVWGCAPLQVQFNDRSLRAENWQWSFPGATPSSSQAKNPSVQFPEPGVYNISLEVFNNGGTHKATYNQYIVIEGLPSADFSVTVNGNWANFEVDAGYNDSISYYWIFDDGFEFPAFDPNHFYFFNGTYEVQMIATNSCGSDTTRQQVVIASPPQASFTSGVGSGCAPFEVRFFDLSPGSPATWQWSFPGGQPASSTERNPEIVYDTPGTYDVQLVVINANGRDTLTETITLTSQAESTLSETLCPGESMVVNGTIYNMANPRGTEILPGGSSQGCDSVITVQLDFHPTATGQLSQTLCEGQTLSVHGSSFGPNNPEGTVLLPGASSQGCDSIIEVKLIFFPDAEGFLAPKLCLDEAVEINGTTYDASNPSGVEIIPGVSSLGCDSLINIQLDFYPNDTTRLSSSLCLGSLYNNQLVTGDFTETTVLSNAQGCDSVVLLNYTALDTSYTALTDTIEMGESYTVGNSTYTESGLYTDTLINQQGCDSIVVLDLTVTGTVSVAGVGGYNPFALRAAPNPFTEYIDLRYTLPKAGALRLELLDLHGRNIVVLMDGVRKNAGAQQYRLDGRGLPAGLYFCRLSTAEEEVVIKVVRL